MTITLYPQARKQKKKNTKLDQVTIRLIKDSELDQWNELICKHHYLADANLTGRQLRYVVEFRRKCLALLSFSAPALALSSRDEWIGWDFQTRRKRIDLIIQNSRFLIFPWVIPPNLASKILSLARNAVKKDWNDEYGYSPLIIETFVDRQFNGTSYLADNWTRLGETAGYTRDGKNYYIQNDSPKTLWCIELQNDARKILCSEKLPQELQSFEREVTPTLTGTGVKSTHLTSLFSHLHTITDPPRCQGKKAQHRQLPFIDNLRYARRL